MEEMGGQGVGKGLRASMFSPVVPPSQNLQVFTKPESFLNPVLLDFCGGFIR